MRYMLTRTGKPNCYVDGDIIHEASSYDPEVSSRQRYFELKVIKSTAANYALAFSYRTEWDGERSFHDVFTSQNTGDIVGWLSKIDPCEHVIGFSDPNDSRQAKLMRYVKQEWLDLLAVFYDHDLFKVVLP